MRKIFEVLKQRQKYASSKHSIAFEYGRNFCNFYIFQVCTSQKVKSVLMWNLQHIISI